ncbi:MAG: hypothetical protein ABI647_26035 [Gemmatimonadota bacterium]
MPPRNGLPGNALGRRASLRIGSAVLGAVSALPDAIMAAILAPTEGPAAAHDDATDRGTAQVSAPAGRGEAVGSGLAAFLGYLSVALHKHRAYPAGHPMREEARDLALRSLTQVLALKPVVNVGVTRRALVSEQLDHELATPVLRELAERLHRRQISTLVFRRGVTSGELADVIQRLSVEPLRQRRAESVAFVSPSGNAEVVGIAYQRLALGESSGSREGGTAAAIDRIWADLARLSLDQLPAGGGFDLDSLTLVLTERLKEETARVEFVDSLEQMGRLAQASDGLTRAAAETKLTSLLNALPRETLATLFGLQSEPGQDPPRALGAVEWLPVDALLDLVEDASNESNRSVSHYMLRMLRKMGQKSSHLTGHDDAVEGGLREIVRGLIEGWSLVNPNTAAHTRILDALSVREMGPVVSHPTAVTEGKRIIQMAIETDAVGEQVMEGLELMLEGSQLGPLLDIVGAAAADSLAAPALVRHLTSPASLRRILLEEPVDHDACERLLAQTPPESAEGLLDALTISESQPTRRLILQHLSRLGAAVAIQLIERIDVAPWYVRRNLLSLLAELPELPAGFSARSYVEHPEPLVRLEAIRLMIRNPADRDDAIHMALADADERVIRIAVDAAAEGLPRHSLTRLMRVLGNAGRSAEIRAKGVRLLAQVDSPSVRDWLFHKTLIRGGFLRRLKLAVKTPELLAEIEVLANRWSQHPTAAQVLKLALASGDLDLAAAAKGREVR